MRSMPPHSAPEAPIMARPACGRTTARVTTPRSRSTPMGIALRHTAVLACPCDVQAPLPTHAIDTRRPPIAVGKCRGPRNTAHNLTRAYGLARHRAESKETIGHNTDTAERFE